MEEQQNKPDIYHERQRLQLCLLHALNNLFQMEGASESETVGTPTPIAESDPTLSPPSAPPVSSSAQRPPRPPHQPSFTETNDEPIGEVDSSNLPAASKGKKRTSWVWKEFNLEGEGTGDEKACCMHCKNKLSGKSSHGTKHLSDHLLKFCVKRKMRTSGQQSLRFRTKNNGENRLENHEFNQEKSRKDLAEMIVLHEYPLSMVDHLGFRRFVSGLNADFEMISRRTLRSDILKMFENGMCTLKKMLEVNQGKVAITTDLWTTSNKKRGYMAVTGHFVDDEWVLQNRTLRFLYVPHPHTSDVLASILMDQCLFLYNLENKISSIVVDNCSTNDSMMDILLGKFDCSSLMLAGKFLHMRCSAHILNLIVKDGLDVIGSGIERIRECIAFWVATPKRYEKFEDSARFLRIQSTKKIHLDCKTRWNSTYLMLDSALPYKANFERLKRMNARMNFSLPNADDWKFAEMICEKLKIFYDVTLLISGRNYPTANLLFRLICEIKLNLESWANSDVEIISGMAYRMIAKFDKYWSEMNGLLAIASILDPRNKLDCVDFYFKEIYKVEASREIQRITSLLYDLLVEYVDKRIETPIAEDPIVSTPLSTSDSLFSQKGSSEGNCQDRYAAHKKTKKRRVNLKSELDRYLEEDVMPDIKQFDILDFWKKDFKYPTLRMIARDVLAIPVSTVASESAFSMGGRVVSQHRSRLHAKTVEALMCLQNWMIGETVRATKLESSFAISTILDDSDSDGKGISEVIDLESENDIGMEMSDGLMEA